MNKPFHDLGITGLISERCHAVEGSILRIHLRLSDVPPLGWSYLFSQAWQVVEYPGKRSVGIEGDAIWIECAPEEVRACHLEKLEYSIAETNARFRSQHQRKEATVQNQRELGRQTQAKLEALARSFAPASDSSNPPGVNSRSGVGGLMRFLRRCFVSSKNHSNGCRTMV
jgi:hypothetical protein